LVISQSPVAGALVSPGTIVALTVSKGPQPVAVPDVVGQTQAAASAAITGANLAVGAITEEFSATVPSGSVISQTLVAGTLVSPGTVVALTVSKGPQFVAVPDVVGQTQAAASAAITGANLAVGAITQEFSATVPSGSVISQTLVAGTLVSPGTVMALTVSKGPQPVAVPDVVGQTQAAASAAITGANLAVGAITQEFSATVASGLVISQLPVAQTLASPGSTVALTVSKGPQTVPNVVGQPQAAAITAITGAGFTIGTVTEEYSDTVPSGSVISQSPVAETVVSPGTAVALTLSKGPQPVPVPDVMGQPQVAASTAITDAGLTVGTVTEEYSDTVPLGTVISQSPAAGVNVVPGTAVNLTVSAGSPTAGDQETLLLPGGVPLVMVWIPGGTFLMGRTLGEQDSSSYEDPLHSVTLGGYWMAKYELTKRQWTAVMNTTPWSVDSHVLADLDSPAVYVSWDNAQSFLTAVNSYTGKILRLPSEAEWEYACRGGTTTRFYWGDDPTYTAIGDYAWYYDNAWNVGEKYAHVVGTKLPNAFGLYDMSGNVWEWCEDDWHSNYTGAPAGGQAWVDSPRVYWRLLRGGGWGGSGGYCRSANRDNGELGLQVNSDNVIGFRVVRTPAQPVPVPVPVPDVVGQTQAAASMAITGAGLSVGAVTEEYSETVPSGAVISTTPASDVIVMSGTAVDLAVSTGPEPAPGTVETVLLQGGVPLEMVRVPGGTFLMGQAPGEADEDPWGSYEVPRHSVTLSGFWIAKYELTKRQWTAMTGTTPWAGHVSVLADLDSPAVWMSWNEAQSFLTVMNSYTGMTFRLPSESQWEYACRGGTTTRFYWGDDYAVIGGYAWYAFNCPLWPDEQYAHVVGLKLPNAFGLYDMIGNAFEWCEDDWHDSYTGAPANGQAWVDGPRGSDRLIRGGDWNALAGRSRSASRDPWPLGTSSGPFGGFRVVRIP
jgi:formylglycine-generating enzyme required for sulfatase activity